MFMCVCVCVFCSSVSCLCANVGQPIRVPLKASSVPNAALSSGATLEILKSQKIAISKVTVGILSSRVPPANK